MDRPRLGAADHGTKVHPGRLIHRPALRRADPVVALAVQHARGPDDGNAVVFVGSEHLRLLNPEVAEPPPRPQQARLRAAREELHGAAERRAAVEGAGSAARHLDAVEEERRQAVFQYTQLPKGSLSGTPSQRTSVRLAPLGPIPRSETPVVVGWEMKLVFRRKSPNPGTRLRASSTRAPGESRRSSLSSAVTSAIESTMVSAARLAVDDDGPPCGTGGRPVLLPDPVVR